MNEFRVLYFAKGVSLNEINPDDVALKCPYMNNLVCTAMQILPIANTRIADIKILKGFVGLAKLNSEYKDKKIPADELKHTQGLALRFTWRNYNKRDAIKLFKELYEKECNQTDGYISGYFKLVISDNDIYFSQEKEGRELGEEFLKEDKYLYRTLKK